MIYLCTYTDIVHNTKSPNSHNSLCGIKSKKICTYIKYCYKLINHLTYSSFSLGLKEVDNINRS